MPTAIISRAISPQEAADALHRQLGTDYTVTTHGSGTLTVRRSPLAFATVRLSRDGDNTIFHVHGGGLIAGRIVNEFGIARTVAGGIKDALGPAHAG
jgi:hypothetical protein